MRLILLLTAVSFIVAAPASAAHYHLKADGTGDYATIQAAVNVATAGDTIICADGTYTGTGNDAIDFGGKNLILKSESNQPKNCVIDCYFDRGFYFHSGETASSIVQGFTIDGGSASNGGGICIENSSPVIFNCVIHDCYASGNGGGIYVSGASANPSILNCIIEQSQALNDGGGIRFYYSLGEARNCTIAYSTGDYAGGISFQGGDPDVVNCIIWGNMPYQLEGAIFGLFSYNLVQGWTGGGTSFDGSPDFVPGTGGSYYLDASTSDALNVGSDLAANICFTGADGSTCMSSWTTRTDQHDDASQVDVGYHYPHYGANIDVPSYKATIQAAIDAAWNGDNVRVADGTYTGDGNRDLDTKGKRITVKSLSGNASACIINCQGSSGSPHRGFYIRKGEGPQTLIKNLKIINGWVSSYGGGINVSSCSPSIQGCILSGNHAEIDGGGLMNYQGNLAVTGCTFINNTAGDAGGGMLNHTCAPAITGCTFEGNSALYGGGGLYNYMASPTVNTCTFRYNVTQHWGGGVHNHGASSVPNLYDCDFVENSSSEEGGAMYNRVGTAPALTLCTFTANEAGTYGGGIYSNASSPELESCAFNGNMAATDGGGIYCTSYCAAIIQNTVFIHNMAEYNAGGFYSRDHDNSSLSNCTFYHNDARSIGGGLYAWSSSPDIANCIFWQNNATAGPQIALDTNCSLSVECCDIMGGQAGIYVAGGSSIAWGSGNINADPIFCHADRLDLTLHSTSPCAAAHSGACGLIGAMDVGCTQTDVQDGTPAANRLHQSYPNPFNPTTKIAFDVETAGQVSLKVFDVSGRLVRTLVDKTLPAGHQEIIWDGKDESGRKLASGAYFCRMTAGAFAESKKIVLLR